VYRSGGAPAFPPFRVRCPFAEWTITRLSPLLIEPDVHPSPREESGVTVQGPYIPGHDYVMVGNILGISGASDDRGAAERAGWRFIQESEFAKGVR
jgi:hypothetical protein